MVWKDIVNNTLTELSLLIRAPFIVPEIWWILTPLLVTLLIMNFYFGKYVREKLGWNTALGNSIVLFFVGIDLLRTIYHYTEPATIWNFAWHYVKVIIILVVMIEGMLLAYTAFAHKAKQSIMFFIASPLPVNLQAYILSAIVYLQTDPTIYTLLAAIVLFAILLIFFTILREIEHLLLGVHEHKN